MINIEKIRIKRLFGEKNYEISFEDNKLILVAENGSGKTTIVNIIYFFISRQWSKLLKYEFELIEAVVSGETIQLRKEEIDVVSSEKFKRLTKRYPQEIRRRFSNFFNQYDISLLLKSKRNIEFIADEFGFPVSLLIDLVRTAEREQLNIFESTLKEKQQKLEELVNAQILYLPTYRRIEQDLKHIFPDLEEELDNYKRRHLRGSRISEGSGFVELVEFGMEDVENKINNKLESLQETFNYRLKNDLTGTYLRDIINKTYRNIKYEQIKALNEEVLDRIFVRIDESVLTDMEKERLKIFVNDLGSQGKIDEEENKILAYFLYRLSVIYSELEEQEKSITDFLKLCNEYSSNKRFLYDHRNFKILIRPYKGNDIDFSKPIHFKNLSSGEKQIVSLFSHIYFSDNQNFILVIDEPELSLSVEWQKRFLSDITKNPSCLGVLAVTHSPFIFENELGKFAHGLNEFEVI